MNVLQTIGTAAKYYTVNPKIVVALKDEWSHTSVNFTEKNKVKKYTAGSILKVKAIKYTANGSPRMQLEDGNYYTGHRINVLQTIGTAAKYYTVNPKIVVALKDEWSHTSVNFTEKNKVKKYTAGSILKVKAIKYTANGSPRMQLEDGNYYTGHRINVLQTIGTAAKYYTVNPKIVVALKDEWSHTSVNFTEKNKVKKYTAGSILKVKAIKYTANGSPRMQLEDGNYYTGHRINVLQTIGTAAKYYTVNPKIVVALKDEWSHTSVNFTEKNKVKKYTAGSILKVKAIKYTANGSPRMQLEDGNYYTGHRINVLQTIGTAAKYYTVNPKIVVALKDEWSHTSVNFTEKNKVKKYTAGSILKVKAIKYTANGSPRMQLEDGNYYTGHRINVLQTIGTAAKYYTVNPKIVVALKDEWSHTSVNFTEKNKVKKYTAGSILKVKAIKYTANGSPRMQLEDGNYYTGHRINVLQTIGTAAKYYTVNPKKVKVLKEDWSHKSVDFTGKNRVEKYKVGSILKVKRIVYTSNGSPRMELSNGRFYTGHKTNVVKYN
ncbi:DUF5776 domain-containing protein [Brochothrix thermosphacta]|uniref:DUF5776 domain-containing protein n=1 Tax=Brochothrix thermosphacta TaxID=2756 RepID=UPI002FCBB954